MQEIRRDRNLIWVPKGSYRWTSMGTSVFR